MGFHTCEKPIGRWVGMGEVFEKKDATVTLSSGAQKGPKFL